MNQFQHPSEIADRRGRVGLATGTSAAEAAAAAISELAPWSAREPLEPRATALVVPRQWRDADARAVVLGIRTQLLARGTSRTVSLLRTPGQVGAVAAATREQWRDVALGPGGERFDRVRVPVRLLESTRIVAAPAGGDAMPRIGPIAIVAAFAHPRQRAVARLAADDPAILAELAAPLLPSMTIAITQTPDGWLAAAATDSIAAELAWLALAARSGRRAEVVPWQDPGVQRLSALLPAAPGPNDIVIAPQPSVNAAVVRSLAEALGIPPDRTALDRRK